MTVRTSCRGFLSLAAATAATAAMAPFVSRAQSPATLRTGHVTAAGSVFYEGAKRFAALFEQKTGGAYKVNVFAGGQLGQEREVMEGMPLGIVDLYMFGTSTLTSIAPEIGDCDRPFLYTSKAQADKCIEGPIGDHWLKLLEPRGIKGMGWGAGGLRSCMNAKRPITKKAEFAGMKFRVAGGPVYIGLCKALGANAIQMTWGEVYMAMQQGVIDGLECPPNVMLSSKFNEVWKFVPLDEHTYSALVFGMADPFSLLRTNRPQSTRVVRTDATCGNWPPSSTPTRPRNSRPRAYGWITSTRRASPLQWSPSTRNWPRIRRSWRRSELRWFDALSKPYGIPMRSVCLLWVRAAEMPPQLRRIVL